MSGSKNTEKTESIESYRQENFRRRSRYTAVFITLAIAFFVIIVININSGNVHIPISRILNILFTRSGDPKEVDIWSREFFKEYIRRIIIKGEQS